jgi:cytochrome c5
MKTLQVTLLAATLGLAGCGDKQTPATPGVPVPPVKEAGDSLLDTVKPAADAGMAAVKEHEGEIVGSDDIAQGKAVYSKYCVACHGTGAAGAPKLSDKAEWDSRASQGIETLTTHVLKGFQGSKGYMPPKGGFANLSDDEVRAAVAYILSESQ